MVSIDPFDGQPFTVSEARDAGVTRARLRSSAFRRLHTGVFVSSNTDLSLPVRAKAAQLLSRRDQAAASHLTAAELLGLPVPSSAQVHLTVATGGSRKPVPGVTRHGGLGDLRTTRVRDIPVVTGASLFCQLADVLELVDLVVVGDAMIRLRVVTIPELIEATASFTGRGAFLAREAATFVRPRVDSAMESRLRLLLVLAGLPEPAINVELVRPDGTVLYRLDLAYPDLLLAIEYDGRQHRDDLDQWDHDLDRDDWLTRHGWERVAVVARGVYVEPGRTINRVRAAIRARGGVVPVVDERWRHHFAERRRH